MSLNATENVTEVVRSDRFGCVFRRERFAKLQKFCGKHVQEPGRSRYVYQVNRYICCIYVYIYVIEFIKIVKDSEVFSYQGNMNWLDVKVT